VGFGRSFREPLSLDAAAESEAEGRRYRVVAGDPDWRLEHRLGDGPAEPDYLFTTTPRRLEDYAGMCAFHQGSPDSPFTRKRLCTLATARGRITFLNGAFVEEQEGSRHERPLSEPEVGPLLRDRFGLPPRDDEV
jgi:N-hydroxyarylamine O-acetyltransferase